MKKRFSPSLLSLLLCPVGTSALASCASSADPPAAGDGDLGEGGDDLGGDGDSHACLGGCGTSSSCVAGTCLCFEGTQACARGCVDTNEDGQNCGACDQPCDVGLFCNLGTCADSCQVGLTPCGNSCVDTLDSNVHCGGCNTPCGAGQSCFSGMCQCAGGAELCSGGCVDTTNSSAHCGGCDAPCDSGQICVEGMCQGDNPGGECEADSCPMATGITHACQKRFALGLNYAWKDFAADFGGLSDWGIAGVSGDASAHGANLAQMKANGASVIRWWMWPDFRGDGVQFDESDDPTGLSATAVSDIGKALELAETNDVYLALTLFSFDNFRPTFDTGGVTVRGMSDLVRNSTRRQMVIDNVVRPAARAVAQSPHGHRLFGWDVINEPEWAVGVTGAENDDFTPNDELDVISLAEMKTFINEVLAALRSETPEAKLSVGWAAAKWQWAFSDITNVDFHQPHIYGWVNTWWPYTSSPSALGYGDKPTVMGEFYLASMPFSPDANTSFGQILESWYSNGYAGAWAWQHFDASENLSLLDAFAEAKGCPVQY